MKANELMIGDWVYTNRDYMPIAQVEAIYPHFIFTKDGEYEGEEIKENDIEPIPLTPEILEKNGFEKEEYGLIWKSEQNVCDINGFPRIYAWVSFWKKGCIREVEISNIDTFYKDKIKQSNTYYVHQLQQALRLCGIEKEITL